MQAARLRLQEENLCRGIDNLNPIRWTLVSLHSEYGVIRRRGFFCHLWLLERLLTLPCNKRFHGRHMLWASRLQSGDSGYLGWKEREPLDLVIARDCYGAGGVVIDGPFRYTCCVLRNKRYKLME